MYRWPELIRGTTLACGLGVALLSTVSWVPTRVGIYADATVSFKEPQESLQSLEYLEPSGQLGGASLAVGGRPGIALLGVGPRVVAVDTKSSPPEALGPGILLTETVRSMFVAGTMAFVATGGHNHTLYVVDFVEPDAPTLLGSLSTPGRVLDMVADGAMLYVVVRSTIDVIIIDISDPRDLQIIGSLDTKYASAIAVHGNRAFVADGPGGLLTVDVTDPSRPTILHTLTLGQERWFRLVDVADTTVVGIVTVEGQSDLELVTFAVEGGGRLNEVERFGEIPYDPAMATYGETVIVTGGGSSAEDGEARLFHVEADSALTVLGGFRWPGLAHDVMLSGDEAYFAAAVGYSSGVSYPAGLRVADVSDPLEPRSLGYFATVEQVSAVQSVRQSIVVAALSAHPSSGGSHSVEDLLVLDADMQTVATLRAICDVRDLDSLNEHLVVACRAGVSPGRVLVYDLGEPSRPDLVADIEMPESPFGSGAVAVQLNLPYVFVGGNSALSIYSISGEEAVELAVVPLRGEPQAIAEHDGQLFVATNPVGRGSAESFLIVFDIRDPAKPEELVRRSTSLYPTSLEVTDEHVFVGASGVGVVVWSKSELAHPRYLTINGGALDMAAHESSTLYVAGRDPDSPRGGIWEFDLTLKDGLAWRTMRRTAQEPVSLAIGEGALWAAEMEAGLLKYPLGIDAETPTPTQTLVVPTASSTPKPTATSGNPNTAKMSLFLPSVER